MNRNQVKQLVHRMRNMISCETSIDVLQKELLDDIGSLCDLVEKAALASSELRFCQVMLHLVNWFDYQNLSRAIDKAKVTITFKRFDELYAFKRALQREFEPMDQVPMFMDANAGDLEICGVKIKAECAEKVPTTGGPVQFVNSVHPWPFNVLNSKQEDTK